MICKMKIEVFAAGLILVGIIITMFSTCILSSHGLRSDSNNTRQMPSSPKQAGLNNITNEFVSTFAKTITQPIVRIHKASILIPLILRNGQLLCRSPHKRQIHQMRALAFIEMVSRGLDNINTPSSSSSASNDYGLPIILMNGDVMGCNITSHEDLFSFPRLSWSIPSPKHTNNNDEDDESTTTSIWCNSVGMVSYETWGWFHTTHNKHHKWDDTFTEHEYRYPWTKKLAKAVWRGTSTHEQSRTENWEFDDIPRARLVKSGIENPDVIDAGFTAIIQKFEKNKESLEKRTRMVDHLPFEELMKYKGEYKLLTNVFCQC